MLVCTGGRQRSEAEFRALYETAGLKLTRIIPTEARVGVIEGVRALVCDQIRLVRTSGYTRGNVSSSQLHKIPSQILRSLSQRSTSNRRSLQPSHLETAPS